jgi:hypothetical protein
MTQWPTASEQVSCGIMRATTSFDWRPSDAAAIGVAAAEPADGTKVCFDICRSKTDLLRVSLSAVAE